MIYKWVRELMERYSFVTSVQMKNAYVYIYYELGEHKDWKRIPYRANREKLLELIEKIKQEIGYYEDFELRKKQGQYNVDEKTPLIFSND